MDVNGVIWALEMDKKHNYSMSSAELNGQLLWWFYGAFFVIFEAHACICMHFHCMEKRSVYILINVYFYVIQMKELI